MSALSDHTRPDRDSIEVVTEQATEISVNAPAEEIAGQLFTATVGAMNLLCVHMGLRLGLYTALAEGGPQSAAQLAGRTGLDTRYTQEWLEQQAIAGLLKCTRDDSATRTFALADGLAEVLLAETSPFYLAPLATIVPTVSDVLPKLERAFRTGDGVSYAEYGTSAVAVQGALNRPWYTHSLAQEWLPRLPDIEAKLKDPARAARVADVGCGVGWAAIHMAKAYPGIRIVGIDDDATSIAQAERNAADEGVSDRVEFVLTDAAVWDGADGFDLVTFFECIHDMPYPAAALANARKALADGGAVLVMDENAAEQFTAPGDDIEHFFAVFSVTWCLPQSRVAADSAAIGTKIRPATMRQLAKDAGFASVDIVDIENPFWRFYRMNP